MRRTVLRSATPRADWPWGWIFAGVLFWAWSLSRTTVAAGGVIPQPYAYWFNPSTNELFLAGGSGIPPGAVPPWRLASEAEILNVVGP